MTKLFTLAVPALVALLGLAPALAGETAVKQADVPKPAIEAVEKKYPGAKLTGFAKEEGKDKTVSYEVQVEDGARKIDVDLTPEGKILAEEEQIDAAALPQEVKDGLAASKYAKWTIKRAEKIIKNEDAAAPSYELLLAHKKKQAEVVFDKAGKIAKEAEKAPKADKDAEKAPKADKKDGTDEKD